MGARLPHACGGVSTLMPEATKRRESSPRLWGCFYISARQAWGDAVFPTPVGVFLLIVVSAEPEPSLPHACGGVSPCAAAVAISTASSPRLWGCFFNLWRAYDRESVFPTPVGVFLASASGRMAACSLPHACGGVSPVRVHHAAANESSPRLWGCFRARCAAAEVRPVFPTPVGVFLDQGEGMQLGGCLPHACGGVSVVSAVVRALARSSPLLWGCFRHGVGVDQLHAVFPTPVGVVPCTRRSLTVSSSLPYARGGVSDGAAYDGFGAESSPRLWGCF